MGGRWWNCIRDGRGIIIVDTTGSSASKVVGVEHAPIATRKLLTSKTAQCHTITNGCILYSPSTMDLAATRRDTLNRLTASVTRELRVGFFLGWRTSCDSLAPIFFYRPTAICCENNSNFSRRFKIHLQDNIKFPQPPHHQINPLLMRVVRGGSSGHIYTAPS